MSSSEKTSSSESRHEVGLGWYQPKSVRISAVEHPAGNILPPDVAIPYLSLCGVWLERLGLKAGHRVKVESSPGRVTLTLDETPVELPYRYRKHAAKTKARQRQLNQQQ